MRSYDIFRALRHFGVSPTEVVEIAKEYPLWLMCPIEEKIYYRHVYFMDGRFVCMPFAVKKLDDRDLMVGIEYKGIIYLKPCRGCVSVVHEGDVEKRLQDTKADFLKRRIGAVGGEDIKFKLPSAQNIQVLYEKTDSDYMFHNTLYALGGYVWIQPDPQAPEKNVAHLSIGYNRRIRHACLYNCNPFKPEEDTEAKVLPIVHFRKGIDFCGKLDRWGVPTSQTLKMYNQLLENIKKR